MCYIQPFLRGVSCTYLGFVRCCTVTILIADDSRLIRENLRKLIESSPVRARILTASEVHSTIFALQQNRVDVLILDIQMPGGTGFEVLEYMISMESRPYTIVLTNYAGTRTKNRSLQLGADLFFDKSNEYEELIDVLEWFDGQVTAEKTGGEG